MKIHYRKGIKLAIRKDDIDRQIALLDTATSIMTRLQNSASSIGQINARPQSKTPSKTARSLARVRTYADRLHKAIRMSWGLCLNSAHQVKLLLEHRVDAVPSSGYPTRRQKQPLTFNVVFVSDLSAGCNLIWYESDITVEDEPSRYPEAVEAQAETPARRANAPE